MRNYFGVLALSFLLLSGLEAVAQHQTSGIWRVRRSEWTAEDERKFSEFIQAIGEAKCARTADCLVHPANPYRHLNPPDIKRAFADCADLPYVLRAYFAFMNDLPFSYLSGVSPLGGARDIRYSPGGNRPSARKTVRTGARFQQVIVEINNAVSSAMFRMDPSRDVEADGNFPDFYPVKLNRNSVRPGTVIYDPNGHVAVVYKVEADGRVRFMDAHPDNSLTRGTYGERFARSRPTAGAGFKNFRPYHARADGAVVARMNSQLRDFSLEQNYGTDPVYRPGTTIPDPAQWSRGRFVHNGQAVGYYDYVRLVLAEGELRFHPIEEFANILDSLCEDAGYRQASIEEAITKGIHLKPHPERLPENIYGTEGEWEAYSTPSRDARFKATFYEARKRLEQFADMLEKRDPRLAFLGTVGDLKDQLLQVYERKASECKISYTRTDGVRVMLDLEEFEKRLFRMSFDPYHCVELRWGAEGEELSSCTDSADKRRWYSAQQRLRNQIERTYDVKMGFTVQELERRMPGSGVDEPPVIDLRGFLENY